MEFHTDFFPDFVIDSLGGQKFTIDVFDAVNQGPEEFGLVTEIKNPVQHPFPGRFPNGFDARRRHAETAFAADPFVGFALDLGVVFVRDKEGFNYFKNLFFCDLASPDDIARPRLDLLTLPCHDIFFFLDGRIEAAKIKQ